MNNLNLTRLGGLKFTQNVLDFMQQSYLGGFSAIAGLLGNNTIVSGVEVAGGNVSSGWVVVNNELMPFEGGSVLTYVEVVEDVVSREYADTTTKDVFYSKKARCSVSGSLLFTNLKKPSIVPSGVIMMWSGSLATIPVGWALCDGTNGTPNLSGRFLVGYNPTDPDHNVIGATGGEKLHTLTLDEIPSHSHGYVGTGTVATASGSASSRQCGDFAKTTNPAGGGLPHENRPPYYTIAYIMKL